MKKTNKTYHVQENINGKVTQSPGRIIKNQPKTNKQKLHSQPSSQSNNSYPQPQLMAINKKVQQQLKSQKLSQQLFSYEQRSQLSSNYSYGMQSYSHKSSQAYSNSTCKRRQQHAINPYQQIYLNDKRYFDQYLNSTSRYEFNGINLNWPYYFSKNTQTTTK